jgi:hypothetical protein
MNDLHAVGAVLAPDEPPQDVVDRSRHRLQQHIRDGVPMPRKRNGWLMAGVGVTVTAAAAAVTIVALPAEDTPTPRSHGQRTTQPAKTVTGQDILLAAATAAERAPEGSGTYWHITVDLSDDRYEYWIGPTGQMWFRGRKTNGQVMLFDPDPNPAPFSLFLVNVTREQLRAMPTEPEPLKAWIVDALAHSTATTSKGPLDDEDRKLGLFLSLVALVSTVPAPPAVRAAAFRAIAAYPGVRSLGAVPGGQGLEMPEGRRLVVDPSTGRVNGTSFFVMDGAVYGVGEDDTQGAKITAEWSDTLPS